MDLDSVNITVDISKMIHYSRHIFLKVMRKRSRGSSLLERMIDALEGHFKKNASKVAFEPCG